MLFTSGGLLFVTFQKHFLLRFLELPVGYELTYGKSESKLQFRPAGKAHFGNPFEK
jgi:hypothetical protein